ncbi:MAG TPA: flagellar biosynthesis protein FlhF [Gammaproteobacteria bacterium]|nr:flagellar biosynthesis protein FlhF [Gammaproteobacteria bacterium]
MKLKRYFAKESRQAIRMVRDELGPDAVILSNQRKDGGVEIVAAVDFEQSLEQLAANQPVTMVDSAPAQEQPEPDLTYTPKGVLNVEPPLPDEGQNEFEQVLNSVSEKIEQLSVAEKPRAKRSKKKVAAKPVTKSRSRSRSAAKPKSEPAVAVDAKVNEAPQDDPAFDEMRSELRYLRGILENQLSGLAWGEMGRGCPQRVELLRRLMGLGLSAEHCQSIANQISDYTDTDQAWHQALALITAELQVTDDDIISQGGVIALVGPTGVGKTTTVAKLAARFALRHGYQEVALITTDSYRIAAYEQLRTYGRILGVPVRVVKNSEELSSALETFQNKRLVLIDTAGMGQRDVRLAGQFKTILTGAPQIKSYILLAANVQGSGLNEVVHTFKHLKPDGCILTKLDECVSLGGVLSVVIRQQLPVAYLSDGQRVPEDIQPARAEGLVERSAELLQQNDESIDDNTMVLTMGGMSANAGI